MPALLQLLLLLLEFAKETLPVSLRTAEAVTALAADAAFVSDCAICDQRQVI